MSNVHTFHAVIPPSPHTKCYLQMYLDPADHYRITSNGKKVLILEQNF